MPYVWVEVWEKKGDMVGRAQLNVDLNQSCAPAWLKLEGKYATIMNRQFAKPLCGRFELSNFFSFFLVITHFSLGKQKTRKKTKIPKTLKTKTVERFWLATQWRLVVPLRIG